MINREKKAKIMATIALLAIVWSIIGTGLTVIMSSTEENTTSSAEDITKLTQEVNSTASWEEMK